MKFDPCFPHEFGGSSDRVVHSLSVRWLVESSKHKTCLHTDSSMHFITPKLINLFTRHFACETGV